MLWAIILILIVLWLLGIIGPGIFTGTVFHALIVIALILIILALLGLI